MKKPELIQHYSPVIKSVEKIIETLIIKKKYSFNLKFVLKSMPLKVCLFY
jgi:hypothetical protein